MSNGNYLDPTGRYLDPTDNCIELTACEHRNWEIWPSDSMGYVRCLVCGERITLVTALNNTSTRLRELENDLTIKLRIINTILGDSI